MHLGGRVEALLSLTPRSLVAVCPSIPWTDPTLGIQGSAALPYAESVPSAVPGAPRKLIALQSLGDS